MYALTVWTTVYDEWTEGADEPEQLDSFDADHTFDHLVEVVDFLKSRGLTEASDTAYSPATWLQLPDGTQPHGWDGNYTGKTEQVTAHRHTGFTDREWFAVLSAAASR